MLKEIIHHCSKWWPLASWRLPWPCHTKNFPLVHGGGRGLHCTACGILVPWPGIESRPSAVRMQSPNHWLAREFPQDPSSWAQGVHCISHVILWKPVFASAAIYKEFRGWGRGLVMAFFWINTTKLSTRSDTQLNVCWSEQSKHNIT